MSNILKTLDDIELATTSQLPGQEIGYDSDVESGDPENMQLDLNLLFRESDEAELENVDLYWEDERSGRSSGQHNSTTGISAGGSTDTQPTGLGLGSAVSASEVHRREQSDHQTQSDRYPPPARVDQKKMKRGSGCAGTKKR